MKENYRIDRMCLKCGSKESIIVSKREAAFELVDINNVLGQKCKKCQGNNFSVSFEMPELDFELLLEWATNIDLHLSQQDEELLLADEKYVENILEILNNILIPEQSKNLLMVALCIIVYDNSAEDKVNKDEQLKNRIIRDLNKRKEKLKQADYWIMDYIKEVVYPQLELNEK